MSSVLTFIGQAVGCGLSVVGGADRASQEQTTSSPAQPAPVEGDAAVAPTQICCTGPDIKTCVQIDAGTCPLSPSDAGNPAPAPPPRAFQCLDARSCPAGTACCVQWGVASSCAATCPSNTTELCQPKTDTCGAGRTCEAFAGRFLTPTSGQCVDSQRETEGPGPP